MEQQKKKDFFISYTSADRKHAEWIAATLKNEGYSIIIDRSDFDVGSNFVVAMDEAIKQAKRIIAVFSPDYFLAKYTTPEWTAVFAQDPSGKKGFLIPIKVRPTEITGLLGPRIYIDLVDLIDNNEEEARRRLLGGINTVANDQNEVNENKRALHRPPDYLLGLLNRKLQLKHFNDQIPERKHVDQGQAHSFCLFGPRQEWPNSIRFKLSHLLEEHKIQDPKQSPEIKPLQTTINLSNTGIAADKAREAKLLALGETHLWKLLAHRLLGYDAEKSQTLKVLQNAKACHIFYREVTSEEIKNQEFIVGMLLAWSQLTFGSNAPSHFLLIICESDYVESSVLSWIFRARSASLWYRQMERLLHKYDLPESLLPLLGTPTVAEDVEDWFKDHFIEDQQRTIIRSALKGHSAIPLANLKEKIFPILQNHHSQ